MALSPSYRTCRALAVRTTGFEGTNFEPQCLPLTMPEQFGSASLYNAGFPGWYLLPADAGRNSRVLWRDTTQASLLKTFGRMCNWNLKIDFQVFYYSVSFPSGSYVTHTRTLSGTIPAFGPITQMPGMNEKMLPHFIYPHRKDSVLETLPYEIGQEKGKLEISIGFDFFHSFPLVDPISQGVMLPDNSDFNGSQLFNTDEEFGTGRPITIIINRIQEIYYLVPRFHISCIGNINENSDYTWQFGWSNPFFGQVPTNSDFLGQKVEAHGLFNSPLVQAIGVRSGYPLVSHHPALTVRVDRFEISPIVGQQSFFEFLDKNGQNPVWDQFTGALLLDSVPLTMDT